MTLQIKRESLLGAFYTNNLNGHRTIFAIYLIIEDRSAVLDSIQQTNVDITDFTDGSPCNG